MGNLNIPISVAKVEEVVCSIVNDKKHTFWLKEITREAPDNIIGTTLTFQSKQDPSVYVSIRFAKTKLYVRCRNHYYKLRLTEELMKLLQDASSDIKFNETLTAVDTYVQRAIEQQKDAYASSLLSHLYDADGGFRYQNAEGLIKGSNVYAKAAKGLAKTIFVDCGGHYQKIVKLDGPTVSADDIREKELYFVDLNPVYDGEFGGFRPCVVMFETQEEGEKNYYVMPLTHKEQNNQAILLGETKEYVVTGKLRLVSAERFSHKFGELPDDAYLFLVDKFRNQLLYFSPEKNSVQPIKNMTKTEVQLGEEYEKQSRVDYSQVVKNVYIPGEELIGVVEQRLKLFGKYDFKTNQGGTLKTKVVRKNDVVEVTVNEGSKDKNAPPIKFFFYRFNAKMQIDKKPIAFDAALTAMYYAMMNDKYEHYEYVAISGIATRENMKYTYGVEKQQIADVKEYVRKRVEFVETELACMGLYYDDIEGLILGGKKSILPNKIHKLDEIEDEDETATE